MPELPEVETIRRDLQGKIVRKKIVDVEVRAKKIVKTNLKEFVEVLKENYFTKIDRRGKLLIFNLKTKDKFLLVHLKMTGQLIYRYDHKTIAGGHNLPKNIGELPNKFTHVIFYFGKNKRDSNSTKGIRQPADGTGTLYYNDMRKFGFMKIVGVEEKEKILTDSYGIDAMDEKFTLAVFKNILEKRKKAIAKAVLMDQAALAGIGNIYADEILYDSRILPNRKNDTLKPEEIKKLYQSIKKVLRHAIRHRGTTFGTQLEGHYVDSEGKHGNYLDFLKVYQREGEKCVGCQKGVIEKKTIAGRSTRFCTACQK